MRNFHRKFSHRSSSIRWQKNLRNAVADQSDIGLFCVLQHDFKLRLRSQSFWMTFLRQTYAHAYMYVALNTPSPVSSMVTCTYTSRNLCRHSDTRRNTSCVCVPPPRCPSRPSLMNSTTSELNFLPSKQCRQNDYYPTSTHPSSIFHTFHYITRDTHDEFDPTNCSQWKSNRIVRFSVRWSPSCLLRVRK